MFLEQIKKKNHVTEEAAWVKHLSCIWYIYDCYVKTSTKFVSLVLTVKNLCWG